MLDVSDPLAAAAAGGGQGKSLEALDPLSYCTDCKK